MNVEKRKEFIINVIYFALIVIIIYLCIKYLLGLFMPFIFGFAIALAIRPFVRFVFTKLRFPKKLMSVICILLFYGIFGFLVFLLGVKIFGGLKDLFLKMPDIYVSSIAPALDTLFKNIEELLKGLEPSMAQVVRESAKSLSSSMGTIVSELSTLAIQGVPSVVSSVPGIIIAIFFSIISSLFFAIDHDKITSYIIKNLPDRIVRFIMEMKYFGKNIGRKYLKGYAILMTITFVELSIGLSILGVENSILIAALIACIDILPVFGTGGVVIPWLIIEIIRGKISFAIGLLVIYLLITVIRNILEPKIIGEQLGLHPLIMLICIFAGAKIFGIAGIFALPICVVVIKHLFDKGLLRFSGTENETGSVEKEKNTNG